MTCKRIVSFVGLVATFAVAYGFERLVPYMRMRAGITASRTDMERALWVESIAVLILAAMLLFLAWYVVSRAKRDIWVGAVFTVVGLVLTFAVVMKMSLESFWRFYRVIEFFAGYNSYGHFVAAFAAVIGIACLVAPKRPMR